MMSTVFYLCPGVLLPGFVRWEWVRVFPVGVRGFVQVVFLFDQGVWYGRRCLALLRLGLALLRLGLALLRQVVDRCY